MRGDSPAWDWGLRSRAAGDGAPGAHRTVPPAARGVRVQMRAVGGESRTPRGTRVRLGDHGPVQPLLAGLGQEGPRPAQGPWEALPDGPTLWAPAGPRASGRWAARLRGEHGGWAGPGSVRPEPILSSPMSGLVVAPGCRRARTQGMGGAAWWRQAVVGVSVGSRALWEVAVSTGGPVELLTRPLSWTVLSAEDGDPQVCLHLGVLTGGWT